MEVNIDLSMYHIVNWMLVKYALVAVMCLLIVQQAGDAKYGQDL